MTADKIIFNAVETPNGVKVEEKHVHGDDVLVKENPRYFSGEGAEERAEQYASRKSKGITRTESYVSLVDENDEDLIER